MNDPGMEDSNEEIMNDPGMEDSNEEIMNDPVVEDSDIEIIEDNFDEEIIDHASDTETDSVDSEDFRGASFEDAVNETLDDSVQQWPNEIYQEFTKICVNHDLSNQATDAFIHFFNKNANLKESPLPKNSREMHKFMDSMVAPNLDFKNKHIVDFEGISYILHYRPIIKTIKALLQKPNITKDFILQFEEKRK
jgi:hypothetical protein